MLIVQPAVLPCRQLQGDDVKMRPAIPVSMYQRSINLRCIGKHASGVAGLGIPQYKSCGKAFHQYSHMGSRAVVYVPSGLRNTVMVWAVFC